MRSLFVITLIGLAALAPEAAFAAKAMSKKTYTVPTGHQRMVSWYAQNRNNVFKAANAEIIKNRGNNEFLVRSKTPVGSSTYVVRETQSNEADATIYRIKFVKQISGRVADNLTIVTVRGRGDESEVTMSVYIEFDHPLAPSCAVKRVTDKSVSKTKALMIRDAR